MEQKKRARLLERAAPKRGRERGSYQWRSVLADLRKDGSQQTSKKERDQITALADVLAANRD